MEKIVNIGDKEVKFKSSAALPHIYRRKFGRDIFVDMSHLQAKIQKSGNELDIDSLEMFENLAYCFAKHADPEIPDDIETWLEGFDTFDIYNILPELLAMWVQENKSTSRTKKKSAKQTVK